MPRAIFILLLAAIIGLAQTTTNKKKTTTASATKRPASKSSAHTRSAVASRSKSPASTSPSRVTSRKVVVTRKLVHGHWVRTTQIVRPPSGPTYQTHPDQERYQQIQQALAQKGYFKGEANGEWGDDSVAALKQFQTENKLSNDGKISALSLMGLGLGPNRETAAAKPDPAAPPAQADH